MEFLLINGAQSAHLSPKRLVLVCSRLAFTPCQGDCYSASLRAAFDQPPAGTIRFPCGAL